MTYLFWILHLVLTMLMASPGATSTETRRPIDLGGRGRGTSAAIVIAKEAAYLQVPIEPTPICVELFDLLSSGTDGQPIDLALLSASGVCRDQARAQAAARLGATLSHAKSRRPGVDRAPVEVPRAVDNQPIDLISEEP